VLCRVQVGVVLERLKGAIPDELDMCRMQGRVLNSQSTVVSNTKSVFGLAVELIGSTDITMPRAMM
jgi:hypothetical protein